MYLCLDCFAVFANPRRYLEKHGLPSPPYETFLGCPHCAGAFVQAFRCDACGRWVTGRYVSVTGGMRFCESCCTQKDLEEEIR